MGSSERPALEAGRETSRRRSRGSSGRVRHVRRNYSGRAIRRWHGHGLGSRQLLCLWRTAVEVSARRQTTSRSRRRKGKGRMDAGAHPWTRRRKKSVVDLENRSERETAPKEARRPINQDRPDHETNRRRARRRVEIKSRRKRHGRKID